MIEIAVCKCSSQEAWSVVTFKQQQVPCIGILEKLLLRNIIKFPDLLDITSQFDLAFTLFYVPFDLLVPLIAVLWVGSPKLKSAATEHNIKVPITGFSNLAIDMIKVDDPLWNIGGLALEVLHLSFVQDEVSLLPIFKPRGAFLLQKTFQPLRETYCWDLRTFSLFYFFHAG